MKKLVLLAILVLSVTSCTAKSISEPINTLTPTSAGFVPVLSNSITKSTLVFVPPSFTPKSTASNKVDFAFPTTFSRFANQFPLSIIPETKGYLFHCVLNADEIEYKYIRIENLEIRKWVKCYFFHTSNHKVDYVIVPIGEVINWGNLTWFTTIADEKTRTNPKECNSNTTCGYSEIIPEEKSIASRFEWTNLFHKYIIELGFGNKLTTDDPSQKFFSPLLNYFSQEGFDKFASTGDADYLPQFDYLEHFLLAYDYLPNISK